MRLIFLLLLFATALTGCNKEDNSPLGRYRSALSAGLEAETGPREAVLGIEVGITDREFFDRCTELNQQMLITMGGGNNLVDHHLVNDLDRPAMLSFWPVFLGQNPRRVQALQFNVIYDDWSPWNQQATAEKLMPEVREYFSRTLGLELQALEHPLHDTVYVNVNGLRHVAIWEKDATTVTGQIMDLRTTSSDPLGLVQ